MMPPCNHCGALRRCEGGLRLGGTVSHHRIPPCPCDDLPGIPFNELVEELDTPIPLDGPQHATAYFDRKFCVKDTAHVQPTMIEVTCDNYDLSELDVLVTNLTWYGASGSCDPDYGRGVQGQFDWINETTIYQAHFNADTDANDWFYSRFFIDLYAAVPTFVEPPNLTWKYIYAPV